ncbi:WPP domain-interacting tail-anchored protein 1-like isoform X2 [Aristolochia californica]|uniref:WPP domain-interacting tail-anchored protein 1-like isoform X2 n=1 Tax=Aristolochia californica TaxID=171875 RepID=UPI0035E13C26
MNMHFEADRKGDATMDVKTKDAVDLPLASDAIFSPHHPPNAEKLRELVNAEILTRIDLDLAYSADRLLNLDKLLKNVAAGVSDYEALAVEYEDVGEDYIESALEFDLLFAVFDSKVRDLDNLMSVVQMDIVDAHEKISSCELLEESFLELEAKLEDSEESLRLLQDQVGEMRMHSVKFQSIIDCCGQESWQNEILGFSENSLFSPRVAKVEMQTGAQQRHILRMLEKSLARELDLENNLTMSINNEEDLLTKLNKSERNFCRTEEATDMSLEKFFEAQTMAEVLTVISKELVDKLHITHLNLNSSVQREGEMRSKVSLLEKQLKQTDIVLEKANSSDYVNPEQCNISTCKITELQSVIENLTEKLSQVESKCKSAEAENKLLTNANFELSQQVALLRNGNSNVGNVGLLEKQLKKSDAQLQHAKALVEANKEKQGMFYSALRDMGNVMEDLKVKLMEAEKRADSAEAKCILLAETNLEQNEEVGVLRERVELLEASACQADDVKKTAANAIDMRTKVISNLLMQLTVERERLQTQISSLEKENSILLENCWKTKSNISVTG